MRFGKKKALYLREKCIVTYKTVEGSKGENTKQINMQNTSFRVTPTFYNWNQATELNLQRHIF